MVATSSRKQVCLDTPARGHHTGIICRGSLPPIGAAEVRPVLNIKSPIGAPHMIFLSILYPDVYSTRGYPDVYSTRGYPDVYSTRGCFRKTAGV